MKLSAEVLDDIRLGKHILGTTSKAGTTEKTTNRMRIQLTEWEKIFENYTPAKGI